MDRRSRGYISRITGNVDVSIVFNILCGFGCVNSCSTRRIIGREGQVAVASDDLSEFDRNAMAAPSLREKLLENVMLPLLMMERRESER